MSTVINNFKLIKKEQFDFIYLWLKYMLYNIFSIWSQMTLYATLMSDR